MPDRYEIRVALVGDVTEAITEDCARDIEQFGEAHWPEAGYVRAKPLTHSGYRNFETFCVANFVSGNYTGEATYRAARSWAAMPGSDAELARRLRTWVENDCHDGLRDESGSLVADLLAGALEEVDWEGIARHVRAE